MMNDDIASDLVREAHANGCIECGAEGCTGCPSAFCDLPRLVEHCREWMCPCCVSRFDAHVANRCTGDVCNCGAPEHVDEEATAKTVVEPYESIDVDAARWWSKLSAAAALALALALGSVGCAHGPAPAVETETVGQLSVSYHSIAVAPVHHDAPPTLGFVVGSDDDDVSSVATTVTRADAGSDDAAPEVVSKGGGLVTGEVR